MLVISHRGAAGLAPENTIKGIRAAIQAGADIVHVDVRLTRDDVPVLLHDARLVRTHRHKECIANLTLAQLAQITKTQPVPTLQEVLDRFYGKVLLNIDLKSRGSAEQVVTLLKKHYIKKASDWDNILISSLWASELLRIRKLAPRANLAMLHGQNPFAFIAYYRFIRFTAVGFHRLHLNPLAIAIARRARLFVYTYTVDRPAAKEHLEEQGIDGIVTNYPNKFT